MAWLIVSIVTSLYLLAGIIFFGRKLSNHSHVKNTISELGEVGSAYSKQVSFGLFLLWAFY